MTLFNPTDKDIAVVIDGRKYSVVAGGSVELEDAVAKKWLSIHAFLQNELPAEEVKEEKKEIKKKEVKK